MAFHCHGLVPCLVRPTATAAAMAVPASAPAGTGTNTTGTATTGTAAMRRHAPECYSRALLRSPVLLGQAPAPPLCVAASVAGDATGGSMVPTMLVRCVRARLCVRVRVCVCVCVCVCVRV